jgi:hypothetical protein
MNELTGQPDRLANNTWGPSTSGPSTCAAVKPIPGCERPEMFGFPFADPKTDSMLTTIMDKAAAHGWELVLPALPERFA